MSEAKDVFRKVLIVVLALFVFFVVAPFVLTLIMSIAGVTLSIVGFLVWLAVKLVTVAVVIAVIYLIVVGIRAVLK